MKPAFGPWNSQSRRMLTGRARATVGAAAATGGAAGAAAPAGGGAALGLVAGLGAQAASRARPTMPLPSNRRNLRASRADMVVLLRSPAPAHAAGGLP